MYMKFKFSKKINNFSYIYRLLYSFSARVTIYISYRFIVRYLIREFVYMASLQNSFIIGWNTLK